MHVLILLSVQHSLGMSSLCVSEMALYSLQSSVLLRRALFKSSVLYSKQGAIQNAAHERLLKTQHKHI